MVPGGGESRGDSESWAMTLNLGPEPACMDFTLNTGLGRSSPRFAGRGDAGARLAYLQHRGSRRHLRRLHHGGGPRWGHDLRASHRLDSARFGYPRAGARLGPFPHGLYSSRGDDQRGAGFPRCLFPIGCSPYRRKVIPLPCSMSGNMPKTVTPLKADPVDLSCG